MTGNQTWLDLTLRVQEDCDIDVQPEGNMVELSWPIPGGSRATILVAPDSAKRLSARLAELVVLIPGGPL